MVSKKVKERDKLKVKNYNIKTVTWTDENYWQITYLGSMTTENCSTS
jgi:hypothetical protein